MTYYDFFCANIQSKPSDVIKGTCYSMCPQDEVMMREKEKLVHVLEVKGPTRRLVKSYSRSAADSYVAVPRLLRPYSVLLETVQYLVLEVTKRTDVPTAVMYDFVSDRLRAVRQDMTIQRLLPEQCMCLLEPMIRFHVYYGYQLWEQPLNNYDPVLNEKYLLECLKWLLNCYDKCNVDDITLQLSGLPIDNKYRLRNNRVLMESLYLLCNLNDVHPMFRYLSLPKSLKSASQLQLSYKIALANLRGNYIAVCRSFQELCPLTYCVMCVYLPELQRRALKVLSSAYNSKVLTVPADVLREWLRFESIAEVSSACAQFGLHYASGAVRFNRTDFRTDVNTLQPKKKILLDEKFNLTIDHIFTYDYDTSTRITP